MGIVVRFTDHEMDALAWLLWSEPETAALRLYADNIEPDLPTARDRVRVLAKKLAKVSWQPSCDKVIKVYKRNFVRIHPVG